MYYYFCEKHLILRDTNLFPFNAELAQRMLLKLSGKPKVVVRQSGGSMFYSKPIQLNKSLFRYLFDSKTLTLCSSSVDVPSHPDAKGNMCSMQV